MSEARSFVSLATHFLRLAESAAELMGRQRNAHVVVTDAPITPQQYNRRTRWSDHAVGVAILFNFYHGIELILKGCLSLYGPVPSGHKLIGLLKQLEAAAPGAPLIATLEPFIRSIDANSPLGRFLAANSISIDVWYQALKYPKSTTGHPFSHMNLKYGESGALPHWKAFRGASIRARKQAIKLVCQV